MWTLLVKNRKQPCWIRVFVVGWWSTVSARGWSAWGYHLWRLNSSNRYWERNMIFPIRTMGKLKIKQPVVWCSCTCQIRYSPTGHTETLSLQARHPTWGCDLIKSYGHAVTEQLWNLFYDDTPAFPTSKKKGQWTYRYGTSFKLQNSVLELLCVTAWP